MSIIGMSDQSNLSGMTQSSLWQEADFPHFYDNPAVDRVLEEKFQEKDSKLDQRLHTQGVGFDDVFTEEIMANSEVEGVILEQIQEKKTEFIEFFLKKPKPRRSPSPRRRERPAEQSRPTSYCEYRKGLRLKQKTLNASCVTLLNHSPLKKQCNKKC